MCGATSVWLDCYESVWGILGLWLHVVEPARDEIESAQTFEAHKLMEDQRERNSSPHTRGYPSEGLVYLEGQV